MLLAKLIGVIGALILGLMLGYKIGYTRGLFDVVVNIDKVQDQLKQIHRFVKMKRG